MTERLKVQLHDIAEMVEQVVQRSETLADEVRTPSEQALAYIVPVLIAQVRTALATAQTAEEYAGRYHRMSRPDPSYEGLAAS